MGDPTTPNPDTPILLEEQDGSNPLNLILCGPTGDNDITGVARSPFPQTGLKISQGDSQYSDQVLPYVKTAQDDFSGGRGAEKFEDDKSRLADSYRAMTNFEAQVFPGSKEHYTTGPFQTQEKYWNPSSPTHSRTTFTDTILVAKKFTTSAAYAAQVVQFILEVFSTPTSGIQVDIYNDSAGSPGTLVGNVDTIAAADLQHGVQQYIARGAVSLNTTTDYWIVLSCASSDTATVVINSADTTTQKTKRYNGSWALVSGEMYFRIYAHWTVYDPETRGHFFTYKGGLYCTIFDKLYLNGDRGVFESNASNTLEDSTKSWTADQFIGSLVYIYRGGAQGYYATITDNGTNWLQFAAPTWDSLDTTSEYVIIGADSWVQVLDFTNNRFVSDVAVTSEFVYFSFGDIVQVERYNCYNLSGTYTERNSTETLYAKKLLTTYDPTNKKYYLWGTDPSNAYYGDHVAVWKMTVPPLWEDLYREASTIVPADEAWETYLDQRQGTVYSKAYHDYVDFQAVGSVSGVVWFHNLDNAVNLLANGGQELAFAVKANAARSAGDIKLILSDVENAGKMTPHVVVWNGTDFRRFPNSSDRDGDGNNFHQSSIPALTAGSHYVYIGAPRRFNSITFNLGQAVNTTGSLTLDIEYFYRRAWIDVAGDSDGTAAGGTTLAQDGNYTFTMPEEWEPGVLLDTAQASGGEQEWTSSGELNDGNTSYYWVRITPVGGNTTALNFLEITVEDTGTTPGAPISIDFPALSANIYTWVTFDLPEGNHQLSAIKSIGIKYGSAYNTDLEIRGGIKLIGTDPEFIVIQTKRNITNLIGYGSEQTDPYVFTESEIFRIQTQNNDSVIPVPLEELESLASPLFGAFATTTDVYLVFSADGRIERYQENQLENIGPDLDNGLPTLRDAKVTALIATPGGNIIAGFGESDKQSSILMRDNGWHEVYRSPIATSDDLGTKAMTNALYHQSIPGQLNRLWVVCSKDILYIDLPLSQGEDSADYLYGSHIVTPWISMGYLDVQKRLMDLKLYTKSLSASNSIRVFYQLETGDLDTPADWTEVSDDYQTSPFETEELQTDYSVSARRLRFKIMFYNTDPSSRPTLYAWILNAILTLDVRYQYTLSVRLDDDPVDLRGVRDFTSRAETIQAQLDTWVASPPTVLTMKSIYSTMGGSTGKKVIVQPYPFRPISYEIGSAPNTKEVLVANIQLLEVV